MSLIRLQSDVKGDNRSYDPYKPTKSPLLPMPAAPEQARAVLGQLPSSQSSGRRACLTSSGGTAMVNERTQRLTHKRACMALTSTFFPQSPWCLFAQPFSEYYNRGVDQLHIQPRERQSSQSWAYSGQPSFAVSPTCTVANIITTNNRTCETVACEMPCPCTP